MSHALLLALAAGLCLLLFAVGTAGAATHQKPHREHNRGHWFERTCATAARGAAACDAQIVTNANGKPLAANVPAAGALGPAQFAGAYSLPTAAPSSTTIAIVDAYDNPNVESNLATFSSYYGLPACTTANGCFRKVDQNGGTTYPIKNSGWGLEIALDVETVHEICQTCKILLVEAASTSMASLGAAENTAVRLGANIVSNSWGGSESSNESSLDASYFNHPGVVITASSGDSGYGAQYPATSPNVVAVGGTTLALNAGNTYNSEKAWSGGGSGCSAYETKPAWQAGYGCAKRTEVDVSADADPNSGAAIYDTYGYSGWVQVGGTSLAAPLIAAVYALSGNTTNPTAPYSNPSALHDVTSGSNGSCSPSLLCNAGVGYDGPTGLGTPNGLAAFGGAPPAPDFSLAVSPSSQSVVQGGSASYTVTMTPNGSFGGAAGVSVSAASAPSDLTASGCATPLTVASPSCTLTLGTTGAATSSHALSVTGTGSAGLPTHTASATLVVQAPLAPDFSLALTPSSQGVVQGGSASYTVTMTPNAAVAGTDGVSVSVSSAPSDLTASGCAAPLTVTAPSCILTLGTTGAATTSHALTVTGTGSAGLPTRAANATLVVQAPLAPDFSLAVSPSSQSVVQGGPASYTVTMTPNSAVAGTAGVTVSASSTPADLTFTGCATPLTVAAPTCTLTVGSAGAATSSHTLNVTGTGSIGLPTHAANATLVVQATQAGDFSLSISPATRVVFTPASPTFTITINALNGFTGMPAFTVTGLPSNYSYSFAASPSGTSSVLTITAPRTSFSTIHFTVTGTSGSLVHSVNGAMQVL